MSRPADVIRLVEYIRDYFVSRYPNRISPRLRQCRVVMGSEYTRQEYWLNGLEDVPLRIEIKVNPAVKGYVEYIEESIDFRMNLRPLFIVEKITGEISRNKYLFFIYGSSIGN